MSDADTRGARPETAADLPVDDVIEVQGDELPVDQDGVVEADEVERERQPSMTELDHAYPVGDRAVAGDAAEAIDGLDQDDLRVGETDDPQAATEEGLTYVPPIDPPVIADAEAPDGIVVAAGAAVSAESEPYDDDHRSTDLGVESDMDARIRDALRADAATSAMADQLVIGTRGSVAVIRGVVLDVDDSDGIVEVVSRVDGITDVVDETELAS